MPSFEEMDQVLKDLSEVLRKYGIEVSPGSPLERNMGWLATFVDIHLGRTKPQPGKDYSGEFSEILGFLDLAVKVLAAEREGKLCGFVPHLKLLNQKGIPSQNVKSQSIDQASHKIFELFIGLLCLDQSSHVELDSPENPKGDNPDVLATIDGTVYGFACKVLNTTSLPTITDRIVDGVRQIKNSPSDRGFVAINLKNLVDHKKYWPVNGEQEFAWSDLDAAAANLQQTVQVLVNDLNTFNEGELLATFDSTQTAGVLIFASTALLRAPGPIPQILGSFFLLRAKHIGSADVEASDRLNRALRRGWDLSKA